MTGDSGTDYYLSAEWLHGIPADLSRHVHADQLARVDDRVYADGATGDVSYGRGVAYPDGRGELGTGPALPATTHTDLVYGPPDASWWATVGRDSDQAGTGGEDLASHPVRYRAGRTYREDWFRPSTAPGFPATTPYPVLYCPACRTDNGMALVLSTATDADPDHSGSASGSATGWLHLRVQQDGTSIVDATDTPALTFPVPSDRHAYRIEVTADRAALGFTAGTSTSAVYTVDSAAGDGTTIPATWKCTSQGTGACTALPLVTITAALPVSPDGTAPAGRSTFLVRVGHVPGAAPTAITALTVDTAVGSRAYQPATVSDLGGGRYAVTVTTTPTGAGGQPVSVRLHAEDAAGATLTQTVTNAYTLATT